MSLMHAAGCCCCECPNINCHTFYYIQAEVIYTDCEGNFPCNDGNHYYFSGLHYSDSCTPPSAADILALYKAGSVSGCPAEGIFSPCGQGNPPNQIQTEYIYPSCTLISSVQNQICAQTYSYPSVGPFQPNNQRDPTQIPPVNQLAYNLFYAQAWKLTGMPDPNCGADYDVGVFGVSFTTPPCLGYEPASCCP